jgi:5-methylcytosine-specific restriction endonuclease McrA
MRRCIDCPNLTTTGRRCPTCTTAHHRRQGTREERGYDTEWRRVRLLVLARDRNTCQVRLKCNGAPANSVDHIVALANGGARLDPGNLRAACQACNSAKGAR